MKKTLSLLLCLTLVMFIFAGCKKSDDDGSDSSSQASSNAATVKTGFAIINSIEKSKDAGATDGLAQADTTMVAVTVDDGGKIVKCVIDGIQTKINFSAAGLITTSKDTKVKTKTELGTDYGMKKASAIGKEWNEEAAALANYVIGKTISEVKGIAVNEKGAPTAAELASSVTISIGGYVAAIEKAVTSATDIGAKATDTLGVGAVTTISKSTDVATDKEGLAQAYSYYAATTYDAAGKITSCIIDGSQTNVNFTAVGKITSDITVKQKTKTELGAAYGMAKVSTIGKEWFEQAAKLSKFVVGKTIAEVKGISVNEKGAPTDSELKSSVTISIGSYVAAIENSKATAK